MADDKIIQCRFQRGCVQLALKVDDVGFVERTIRLFAHLHGMENLALGLGRRGAVEARKRHRRLDGSCGEAGRNPAACISVTESVNALTTLSRSSSVWAVVK